MKFNTEKCKYMIINFTDNYRFNSRLLLDDRLLEQVTETRLLGVVMNDQLTWQPNTDFITKKAYKRMIMLHKLFDFGLQMEDMLDIYILYIRSILESSSVVWHSSITQAEIIAIERVQKVALRIILDDEYESYDHALRVTGLPTLKDRRTNLCKKFATNCTKSEKLCHMFPLNPSNVNTRQPEKFYVQPATTGRLADSAIPYMQRLLNKN